MNTPDKRNSFNGFKLKKDINKKHGSNGDKLKFIHELNSSN